MALEDFVKKLASHEFAHLLHLRNRRPAVFTNSLARSILESEPALNRPLTGEELAFLQTLVTGLNADTFIARDFEAAAVLQRTGWITPALFRAAIGM